MLNFLPAPVKGIICIVLIAINTLCLVPPLVIMALFKRIIPGKKPLKIFDHIIIFIATSWVRCNSLIISSLNKINWDIHGLEQLTDKQWYMVVSNHQSWTDIIVLQTIFIGKIPFLKFFLKKELIWVPVIGLAWWGLDFPFMKRYSSKLIKQKPHLKGKDLEITKKACKKFKNIPISVMNFVEGTRFTQIKHKKQNSPYDNLLKPRAGGIAFVLGAMSEHLDRLLNVTIAYPEGSPSFWGFLCGRTTEIKVDIESLPITEDMVGDYSNDPEFKNKFQSWINDLWAKKDQTIARLLEKNIIK